jgi:hypothetical protein
MSQATPVNQYVRTESPQSFLNRVFGLFGVVNGAIDIGVSTQTNPTNYTGNLSGQWVNVTAPGSANTEFSLTHSLGRIPSFYWFIADRSCNLYQLPNTGTAWTSTKVYVKCDTASAVLRVFIL